MDGDRETSSIATPDQWVRCAHRGTTLDPDGGVQLAWELVPAATDQEPPAHAIGLAFDRWDGGYRSDPSRGEVVPFSVGAERTFGSGAAVFAGPWQRPAGLGVVGPLLFIAEADGGTVAIVDLVAESVLRRTPVGSPGSSTRPLDVAVHGRTTYVLLEDPVGIVHFRGRRGPLPGPAVSVPRCPDGLDPRRLVVVGPDRPLVLWLARDSDRAVVADVAGHVEVEVAGATDLEVAGDGTLVVARGPGEAFRRFRHQHGRWTELEPVLASGYDGSAIAAADGAIAYSTASGIAWLGRSASSPPVRYTTAGRVITYRLDSGTYRTRWGRIFVDACVPPGTDMRCRFLTSDEDDVDDPLTWTPPEGSSVVMRRPDLTPPLPSELTLLDGALGHRLHRRADGREWPWAQIPADDRFETYEAPVRAGLGRYLWVILDLVGTTSRSPRVRELRVERPGHGLLGQLPRSWSRHEEDAEFLQRFLAPSEGVLAELDERAATRDVLLDPQSTPQEVLPWLGSFVGLVLDRRWPVDARRAVVAEAYGLLRRRGTPWALRRMVDIYLGRPVVIVEQWRLRGVGGIVLGGRVGRWPAAPATGDPVTPILGGSARLGGTAGAESTGGPRASADGFRTNAHRFTVLVPACLSPEQIDVVTNIVATQRPAHTEYTICGLGTGMRIGQRLHLGLTSVVGPGAAHRRPPGFEPRGEAFERGKQVG